MIKLIYTALISLLFAGQSNAQESYFIKNVNYIDVYKGELLKNVNVKLVKVGKGFKINVVGTAANNKNTKGIDGTGKYLMPALYDMHVHWPDVMPTEFFKLVQQAGVGAVRIMNSKPAAITFAKANKQIDFKIGYPFNKYSIVKDAPFFVDSIKKAGYDFIKIFSVKDEAAFLSIAQAAKKISLPICGHALPNVAMQTVFENGYTTVEHVGYFDELKTETAIDSTIAIFKKYNVAVCPTLDWVNMAYHAANKDSVRYRIGYQRAITTYKTYWDTTYAAEVKSFGADEPKYAAFAKNSIAKKISILKKMHEAGIKIIIGSDAEQPYQVPGFSIIEEMKLVAQAGFSNMELLQFATINSEAYFNAAGFSSSNKFILLNKNPLENLNNLGELSSMISLQQNKK
jgi:imidazolonepropionase-like amidohydrolase